MERYGWLERKENQKSALRFIIHS